jgi:hypothetical protein
MSGKKFKQDRNKRRKLIRAIQRKQLEDKINSMEDEQTYTLNKNGEPTELLGKHWKELFKIAKDEPNR